MNTTRWVVAVSICVLAASVARAESLGAMRFEPPSGWTRTAVDSSVTFVPPGLGPEDRAVLAFLPGEDATDPQRWFEASWNEVKRGFHDVQEVPVASGKTDHGHRTLLAAGSMADPQGRFVYVTLFAVFEGQRVQPALYVASSSKLYNAYTQTLNGIFNSIGFSAPSSWPRASGATFASSVSKVLTQFRHPSFAPPSSAPAPASASASAPTPAPAAAVNAAPHSIQGRWRSGTVSAVGYYNPATGSWAAPTGAGQRYEFRPDGTYEYSGLAQTSMYGCTTSVFSWERGRYSVSGGNVTFRPTEEKLRSRDNCNKRFNYEKNGKREVKTWIWRLARDSSGDLQLVLRDPGSNVGEMSFYEER